MTTDDGTLFLALLASAAAAGTVALWGLRLGAAAGVGRGTWATVAAALRPQALAIAALVAAVATAGSLWLSEGAGFPPCELCWYQRIAMYPLTVLLAIGALRHDDGVRLPALVIALGGAAVSTWHILVERFPSLADATTCDPANPCSIKWVEELGFLTIPTMALIGFLSIATLLLVPRVAVPGGRVQEVSP